MTVQPEARGRAAATRLLSPRGFLEPVRYVGLDRLRGLAIALMVVDHVCVVTGEGELLRATVGRAAFPLFFLVSGLLVRGPKLRWVWVFALGVALPFVVPWVDSPNVLVLYVLGACAVWLWAGVYGYPAWLLALPALVAHANGWVLGPEHGFDPLSALALMGLGWWCLPVTAGARLPAFLGWLGRYPLSLYVGHLLLLQLVYMGTQK